MACERFERFEVYAPAHNLSTGPHIRCLLCVLSGLMEGSPGVQLQQKFWSEGQLKKNGAKAPDPQGVGQL